jgi:hypothetical protein
LNTQRNILHAQGVARHKRFMNPRDQSEEQTKTVGQPTPVNALEELLEHDLIGVDVGLWQGSGNHGRTHQMGSCPRPTGTRGRPCKYENRRSSCATPNVQPCATLQMPGDWCIRS